MTQIRRENAAYKIDGYIPVVWPGQTQEEAFQIAKSECLIHLRAAITDVEATTFEQYTYEKKKGF